MYEYVTDCTKEPVRKDMFRLVLDNEEIVFDLYDSPDEYFTDIRIAKKQLKTILKKDSYKTVCLYEDGELKAFLAYSIDSLTLNISINAIESVDYKYTYELIKYTVCNKMKLAEYIFIDGDIGGNELSRHIRNLEEMLGFSVLDPEFVIKIREECHGIL